MNTQPLHDPMFYVMMSTVFGPGILLAVGIWLRDRGTK